MSVQNPCLMVVLLICWMVGVINTKNCDSTCTPPECSCPTFTYPLPTGEIPQMVFFGFDDAVTSLVTPFYQQLFTDKRTNPNGCKMKMSLFVSDHYTDYSAVKRFYDDGHEIGVHSVTHRSINTDARLRKEAKDQKENLVKAGIPTKDIVGWRSPNLQTAGENQPAILQELGYTYDISLTYVIVDTNSPKPWPFTMQNGWPYNCGIQPCPVHTSITDFWTVPVVAMMDKDNAYPCAYVDGCTFPPSDTDEAFTYLWNNFMSYYNTSRAPFGLNMHAAWFYGRPYNLDAMAMFMDRLMGLSDVYVVTVGQMLDWMRTPTPIADLDTLQSWQCGDSGGQSTSTQPSAAPSTASTQSTVTASLSVSTASGTQSTSTPSTTTDIESSGTSSTDVSSPSTLSPSSTSAPSVNCKAIGLFENVRGMESWCRGNCLAPFPYCPKDLCEY